MFYVGEMQRNRTLLNVFLAIFCIVNSNILCQETDNACSKISKLYEQIDRDLTLWSSAGGISPAVAQATLKHCRNVPEYHACIKIVNGTVYVNHLPQLSIMPAMIGGFLLELYEASVRYNDCVSMRAELMSSTPNAFM